MTEAELLERVLAVAAEHDVLAFHCYDSRTATGRGFPDLVLLGSRHLMFAELKSSRGGSRPGQAKWKWRLITSQGEESYARWEPRHLADGTVRRVIASLNDMQRAA